MTAKAVRGLIAYVVLGILFGVMLIKSEVVSWFRIYEMFRFQSFHMYGIIGSAVLTAGISLQVIRRMDLRTADGEPIAPPSKVLGRGTSYWAGGVMFGLGWGIVGACPGPLFALIGAGVTVMIVPLCAALLGTAAYGLMRSRLPH
jgi:uncharacterized membrane protein YedE/YeeE